MTSKRCCAADALTYPGFKVLARARMVEIARRNDLLIIEDASYAYLADEAPLPLAALALELTIYVSGLSKSVATGLRVGSWRRPHRSCPRSSGRSGRPRGTPQPSPPRSPAAYFVWLPLPEEARADRIAAALAREHISVATAEPFAISAPAPQAIRLALGSAELPSLRAALSTVRQIVETDAYG